MGAGVAIFLTELWRDPEGRGCAVHGALDGPQIAAVAMVLAGALVLREREVRRQPRSSSRMADATQAERRRGPA